MPLKIDFVIPGRPTTKKNSSRIITVRGRHMVIPSKQFMDYQKGAEPFLPHKGEMIDTPMNLKAIYYMPTRHKVDLANLLSATCDILTHYKVIADDNSSIVVAHDGSRVLYDKDNPRAEITLEEWESNDGGIEN